MESRKLVPLIANGSSDDSLPPWGNLFNKQLLLPFDNDQWLRYEAVPFRVGQISYDMTVVFDPETREGLLIGALDFNVWKNGMSNSHTTTNVINCICGVAGEGTHDVCQHGSLIGRQVTSSRFAILAGPDYRDLLEAYGDLLNKERMPLQWREGIPFGFNAFAGLGRKRNNDIFARTSRFIRDELLPRDFGNQGVTYTNLDGGWQMLDADERLRNKEEMHAHGQKAGIYDGPFVCRPFGERFDTPLPGVPEYTYGDILLRDEQGEPLPPVDGLYALDVTHPAWREFTIKKFEDYKKWEYDYLKIDFLTHGCMEGVHYDKSIRTGQQALTQGSIVWDSESCDALLLKREP